jgi:protein-tyrosine phosphatase
LVAEVNADRVAKNLWVGGVPTDPAEVDENFDALVLSAKEFQDVFPVHQYPGTYVIHAPMVDGNPSTEEIARALDAGIKVFELNSKGKKVLVTCAAGVNRSALIAALAMVVGGVPADGAVNKIRKNRKALSGSMPLFNPFFVNVLKTIEAAIRTRDSHIGSLGAAKAA